LSKLSEILKQYCDDVLSDKIISCIYVKQAVQRHLDDLQRDDITFSEEAALKPLNFISNLSFTEGEWAGQKFKLESWQIFIIANMFGWLRPNGRRRFKYVDIAVPRKNAKSTLAGAIGNFMLYADGEGAPQVYSAATKLDQAKYVFNAAAAQVRSHEILNKESNVFSSVNNNRIVYADGFFRPLEWRPESQDGMNPSFAVIDEYHAHKNDDLVDVLETGMGARMQPILFKISTEGFGGLASPFSKRRKYLEDVLSGNVKDDSVFAMIYTIDEGDDWTEERSWIKANPNWKVSVYPSSLSDKIDLAKNNAQKGVQFKTKHLNIACNTEAVWISDQEYMKKQEAYNVDQLVGLPCYGGLDLASVRDFTALVLKFPLDDGTFKNIYKYYLPEIALENRNGSEQMMCSQWQQDGFLTITEGNVTDYAIIKADILKFAEIYDLRILAYDRYNASDLASSLLDELGEGILIPMHQSIGHLTAPCKALEVDILNHLNQHNNNPIQRWMFSNTILKIDHNGNQKPNKEKSKNKIDGVVAEVMAKGAQLHHEANDKPNQWFAPIEFN